MRSRKHQWKGARLAVACLLFRLAVSAQADAAETASLLEAAPAGTQPGFTANEGQWNREVRFAASVGNGHVVVTRSAILISERRTSSDLRAAGGGADSIHAYTLGLPPAATVRGKNLRADFANFFLGSDPSRWRSRVLRYDRVVVEGLAPGIDLELSAACGSFHYDLIVAGGADLSSLWIPCEGVRGIAIRSSGELELETPLGRRMHARPRAFVAHIDGSRSSIGCFFRVDRARTAFGFECRGLDDEAVVIDPTVAFSTYLGGLGDDDVNAIALRATTRAPYVTGSTKSANFPVTAGVFDPTHSGLGDSDAFVTALNGAGTAVVYSTYIGGDLDDAGRAIAVDAQGNVSVTGETFSAGFPTTGSSPAARWTRSSRASARTALSFDTRRSSAVAGSTAPLRPLSTEPATSIRSC